MTTRWNATGPGAGDPDTHRLPGSQGGPNRRGESSDPETRRKHVLPRLSRNTTIFAGAGKSTLRAGPREKKPP